MRKVHACLLLLAILLMPMMGIGENADIAEGVAMWINGEAVYQSQIDSVTASVTESMACLVWIHRMRKSFRPFPR